MICQLTSLAHALKAANLFQMQPQSSDQSLSEQGTMSRCRAPCIVRRCLSIATLLFICSLKSATGSHAAPGSLQMDVECSQSSGNITASDRMDLGCANVIPIDPARFVLIHGALTLTHCNLSHSRAWACFDRVPALRFSATTAGAGGESGRREWHTADQAETETPVRHPSIPAAVNGTIGDF